LVVSDYSGAVVVWPALDFRGDVGNCSVYLHALLGSTVPTSISNMEVGFKQLWATLGKLRYPLPSLGFDKLNPFPATCISIPTQIHSPRDLFEMTILSLYLGISTLPHRVIVSWNL